MSHSTPRISYPYFDPATCRAELLRLISEPSAGHRIWCHALSLGDVEVAHGYTMPGTVVPAHELGAATCVLRVGGGVRSFDGPSRFVDLCFFPDGRLPTTTYSTGTHEFVLRGQSSARGVATSAPATNVETAWRLIMSLRLAPHKLDTAREIALALLAAVGDGRSEGSSVVTAARRLLDDGRAGGPRTRSVAAALGVSESYLCRVFRGTYRGTISAYVAIVRGARAAGLLWGTDLSLAAVATDCGYADQSHLTRDFRARFGLAPSDFRRLAPCLGKTRLQAVGKLQQPAAWG